MSRNAPGIFLKTLPNGLPIFAVIVNSLFTLLSYMGVKQGNEGPGLVFMYFAEMAAVGGLVTWLGIVITYLRFYKGMQSQGNIVRNQLPYYSNLQPFAAWYAVCSISFILFVSHPFSILFINWSKS